MYLGASIRRCTVAAKEWGEDLRYDTSYFDATSSFDP